MPEPGSEAEEAVRDAREAVGHEAMVDIAFENLRLRWRPAPKLSRAEWRSLFSEPEAAIRASGRAKVEALIEAADAVRPLHTTGPDWWRCALCGHKERQLTRDPAAMHEPSCA